MITIDRPGLFLSIDDKNGIISLIFRDFFIHVILVGTCRVCYNQIIRVVVLLTPK